ncbi:MAG: zinc-ribbon domain-containing protein [Thaumarchaeota archaeon]|nr:zinc-ribbon domain-containing protein [Nitrososphaerota archaeon]
MSFCPSCGKELLTEALFCWNCGYSLGTRQVGPTPSTGGPPASHQGPEHERTSGLEKLKNSFLLYLIGGGLSVIPIIGAVGGLIELAGFIFLILGWRALGRSSFLSAAHYKSTGRWLVYSIIAGIIIAFVGVIVLIISVFASVASSIAPGSPISATDFIQGSGASVLLGGLFALIAVAQIPLMLAWNKVRSSMRLLSKELSQPRVSLSGWLFLLVAVIGLASLSTLSVYHYLGAESNGTPLIASFVSTIFYAEGLVTGVLVVVASLLGYAGIKRVLGDLSNMHSGSTMSQAPT